MVATWTEQDELNRRTWTKPSSMRWLDQRPGFIPGEREAFAAATAQLRGRPILELGVGMGRTIDFTAPLTRDYRALDYLPGMVESARASHPGVRVDLGDARTLDGLPDGHFGLVTFAWNGIDAVAHADRGRVLDAVRRVLAPDGVFFFSTLNLDGPETRERPWQVPLPWSWNPLRLGVRTLRAGRWAAINVANWIRMQPMIERGPGYAVAPMGAHAFGILAHYTTLARQLDELAAHGFRRDALAFSSEGGAPIGEHDDARDVAFFHLVARPSAG